MPKKQAKVKSWTFMVYMGGDNNLEPDGVKDLKEMKKVGSTDDVNVIAQFDRATGHTSKRYYLRKGGQASADAVATVGKVNTGDPKNLMDFIKWGVKAYPAKRYILVLWNHGQGWDDTDIYADERHRRLRRLASGRIRHALFHTPVRRTLKMAIGDSEARAILLDDDAKDFLDNLEMKKVLADTKKLLKRKLDILGMDACLMSMAEVGYQISDSAAFTVGSEETEPLEGWPYDTILAELVKKAGDDREGLEHPDREKIHRLLLAGCRDPVGLRPVKSGGSRCGGCRSGEGAEGGAGRSRNQAEHPDGADPGTDLRSAGQHRPGGLLLAPGKGRFRLRNRKTLPGCHPGGAIRLRRDQRVQGRRDEKFPRRGDLLPHEHSVATVCGPGFQQEDRLGCVPQGLSRCRPQPLRQHCAVRCCMWGLKRRGQIVLFV